MRVTFYTAVLVVAAGSVVFGLDWISAPMPPMPEAKNIVFLPPPPPPPPRVAAPVTPVTIPTPQSAPAPAPQRAAAPASLPPVQTPAPLASPAMVEAPKVKCDIEACAAAYRSFRDSDCTYNPSFGPRRLCTKGDPERYSREHPEIVVPTVAPAPTLAPAPEAPPVAQTAEPGSSVTPSIMAPEPGTAPATPAATPPRCNVAACAASYPRSFKEADCTFQPSIGPRRVCEK